MENMIKTQSVKIGGRTFSLAFTLKTMFDMQENIEGFDYNQIDEIITRPKGLVDVLYYLAKTGEALEGREMDVDKDWFALHIPPSAKKIIYLQLLIRDTMQGNMHMESEEDDDRSREVDLVLQELQKKREKTD